MADHYAIIGTSWGAGALLSWGAASGDLVGTLNDPTATDNVIFDANSPNVVCSGAPVGLSLTTTGYNGTISGAAVSISGSVTLSATTIITVAALSIIASGTLTANGATLTTLIFMDGSGITFDLGGALICNSFRPRQGTLNTNNYAITCGDITSNAAVTRVLNFGSSVITITGDGSALNFASAGMTLNAGTSVIKFTSTSNNAITFAGLSKTFYDVWFDRGASTGTITITGANTFHDFYDSGTGAHTRVWPNSTTTATTWRRAAGTNVITNTRTGGSGTWTLSVASGVISVDYMTISNSAATGGAKFYAGANSTDGGGNTGWIFRNPGMSIGLINGA